MAETEFDVDKHADFNTWFNQIVQKADLVDQQYGAKGFVVRKPMTMLMIEAIRNAYEREYQKTGHLPVQFPTVVPEDNFAMEEDHVEGFAPEVFWVTEAGSDKKQLDHPLALKPTGETAMYPSYARWIRSYRDLPLKRYQFGTVFRYETKATKPFLREREFVWFESHNVFASEAEMQQQIQEDMAMTRAVVEDVLSIPFLYMQRPAWDTFAGAVNTYAADVPLPNGKSLQIGSTHELGQHFSKPFHITFFDEDTEEKYAWQTCWGPGVSRQVAAAVSVHGDNKGLVLPFHVAPYQIAIIPVLFGDQSEGLLAKGRELCQYLREQYRTVLDDSDKTPGEKFNHWELHGACIRIEIGPQELDTGQVTLVRRDTGEKITVTEDKILDTISQMAAEMTDQLYTRAQEVFDAVIVEATTFAALKEYIADNKTVKVPFCSIATGESCADTIADETTAEVRGVNAARTEEPAADAQCVVCGQPAHCVAYVAIDY